MRATLLPVLLTLACEGSALAADPSVAECLSASNTSAQLRLDHKLRQARDRLRTCVSVTCPEVIRAECAKRMDQVTVEIPTIVFAVRDASAATELSAVKVTMDDEVVADHLDGSAIDLDPGEHRFTFEAAGRPPLTETLVVHEGDKNRAEVVILPAGTPTQAEGGDRAVVAPPPRQDVDAGHEPVAASRRDGRAMRIAGLVSGGVGIAGLVAGGIFGAMAFESWGQADKACPTREGCSGPALANRHDAVVFSTVSDVGFIAGGALVALGLSLVLLAPKSTTSPAVAAQAAPGWLGLSGRF